MVHMPRSVRVVSDEAGDVLGHPPRIARMTSCTTCGRREGVEAPVVHRRQAQPVLVPQGKFPVRLQLES